MRSLAGSLLTIFAFFLGGCNSQTGGIDVSAVQAALKSACGVELAASTALTEIQALTGEIPGLSTAQQVADLICSSMRTQMAGKAGAPRVGVTETVNVQNKVLVHVQRAQ